MTNIHVPLFLLFSLKTIVVSLRQLERQMARDKEKHSGRLHELQAQYDDHTGQLQAKLHSTEAERNLLMVGISSRIHLCSR